VTIVNRAVCWAVLVSVAVFFGLAVYWAIQGVIGSLSYLSNAYVYDKLSDGPFWWLMLYYSSEGTAGTVGLVVRAFAGFFAFYAAALFVFKKETALPKIKKNLATALLLEAIYCLSLIPSTLTAFAYYFTNGSVFYFDHTPALILLYVAALPTLAMVTVVPTVLLKLRSKIAGNASAYEVTKWSSLTAFTYVLVVFWFGYSMSWLGNMVPFDRAQGQYGWSFLLEPLNFVSFVLTVFGLLAVALTVLRLTYPTSKESPTRVNIRGIGLVMFLFGCYFIFNLLYFYLTGGYAPHPNVWYEMIGPPHNVNLWALVFVFLGLVLMVSGNRNGNK
jgi:hypothetical protein